MQPITRLLAGVQKISQGALDTKIQEVPVFEFNELARSINVMAASLKERDLELKSHYQELTDTHQQLQASFNQLEEMSLELERSEELYKSLLQDASDAIVVLGADPPISGEELALVEIVQQPPVEEPPQQLPYMEAHKVDPSTGEDEFAPALAPALAGNGNGAQSARNPNDPASWGKVGRNEPCPCGSGKKYKHCHGRFA